MRFWRSLRICAAALAASTLIACSGGIGDIGPPAGNAQAGSNGGGAPLQGASGTTVAVGQAYSFQPDTSAVGNATFTARNLPQWLSLNASTGRLTGTPTEADIGTYSGIVIEASNGTVTSSLGPFTISVVAQGDRSASISWTAPTENTDGSTLTDLKGFVVVYGMSPTELTQTITIDNPSVTTYVVENLTSGTWYFAVQAANGRGTRSAISEIGRKTIS